MSNFRQKIKFPKIASNYFETLLLMRGTYSLAKKYFLITIWGRKYFLAKLYVPLRQFLEIWFFDGNSTSAILTKIVKILYYLKLWLENIFWLNYMFPSSKEVLLHNFRQFLENWYFDGISTGADLTKIVKFCSLLNCDKEIFFG